MMTSVAAYNLVPIAYERIENRMGSSGTLSTKRNHYYWPAQYYIAVIDGSRRLAV
jgi:hypothetical protein